MGSDIKFLAKNIIPIAAGVTVLASILAFLHFFGLFVRELNGGAIVRNDAGSPVAPMFEGMITLFFIGVVLSMPIAWILSAHGRTPSNTSHNVR